MLGPQRARRASWAVARYPAVWALTLGNALEMIQQTLLTQRHLQNRGAVAPLLLSVDNGRAAMALEVRRIVTGHDASGKAIIKTDERLTAASRLGRSDVVGCEIWSTDRMPVDNSEESDAEQRKGFVTRYNYVGTGEGIVIRINEFAPG